MFRTDRHRVALRGVLTLATLVAATACAAPSLPELSAASRVEAQCPPLSDATYLAAGSLQNNRSDEYLRTSYGELLRKASAPRLWCGQGPTEAYRLLLLPSYGPALIVIALRTDDGWTLRGVEFTTKDPTPWSGWVVERRAEKHIPTELMAPMFSALQRGAFWTTSLDRPAGDDGVLWTLEGRRLTGYRAVTRWSRNDPELIDAARTLVRLSGLNLPEGLRERRKP